MSAAQIAAVCWARAHGISEKPQENGFEWLREDITRVVGKLETDRCAAEADLFKRYAYVERQKKYYDLVDCVALDHEQLTNRFAAQFGMGRDYNAHVHWQLDWEKLGGVRVYDFTYWPGKERIVEYKTKRCINEWSPPPPIELPARKVKEKDIEPWMSLVRRLIPNRRIRDAVLNLSAFLIQKPGAKCNHHLLLVGKHGIGKDTLTEPIQFGIGGGVPDAGGVASNRMNIKTMRPDDLERQWGYHLRSQLCVVQEIVEIYNRDKRKLVNKLKPELSSPPADLTIEEKNRHPYDIPNVINWIFFSNSTKAIGLERTERRFLAVHSNAEKMTSTEARRLWKWYRTGGLELCVKWLRQRNLKKRKFDPKAAPMVTKFQETLAEAAMPMQEQSLNDVLHDRSGPFAPDIVVSGDAARYFADLGGLRQSITGGDVSAALTAAGWIRLGAIDISLPDHKPDRLHKRAVFVSPGTATKYLALRRQSPKKFALAYFAQFPKARSHK